MSWFGFFWMCFWISVGISVAVEMLSRQVVWIGWKVLGWIVLASFLVVLLFAALGWAVTR